MTKHLTRKSDSQANAEFAFARRERTYADEHAKSWDVRFDRPTHEPKSLRGYVNELRQAYAAEVPSRLHSRDVDGGGTPAFSPQFEAWLYGSPHAIDQATGAYSTPLRACLAGMHRSTDEASRKRSAIAGRVIVGGTGPAEAAIEEGVPAWCAKMVAFDALRVTWRRLTTGPMALPTRESAA